MRPAKPVYTARLTCEPRVEIRDSVECRDETSLGSSYLIPDVTVDSLHTTAVRCSLFFDGSISRITKMLKMAGRDILRGARGRPEVQVGARPGEPRDPRVARACAPRAPTAPRHPATQNNKTITKVPDARGSVRATYGTLR